MEDLIKREDAIKAVAEVLSLNRFASFKDIKDFGRFAERMLRNVPSADRPQGEWIYRTDVGWHATRQCSLCGWMQSYSDTKYMEYRYNYCPNCGCRMKGAEDER